MKSESTEETNISEAIPSFYELFALYLNDEWKGVLTIVAGTPYPYISLQKRVTVPETGTPTISHSFIGYIDGNSVTLFTTISHEVFHYAQSSTEIRNAADPTLFEWFSHTVRHEHYQALRDMGFLDKDGLEDTHFIRLN